MKITRRRFAAGMGGLLAMTGIPYAYTAIGKANAKRPNIILFLADDMRFDATSYAGNPLARTPTLDALAKDSFVFDNSFVTTSICPTSRASIYSGEYALQHGVNDFVRPIARSSYKKMFFIALRKAGYHTMFIGKWGMGGNLPEKEFDAWYGFSGQGDYYQHAGKGHLTDRQTAAALAFLKDRPKDKPFLLIVAYKAPHAPFQPQERFSKLHDDITVSLDDTDNVQNIMKLPPLLRKDFKTLKKTPEKVQRRKGYIKGYYQLVAGMDDSVGKVLGSLEEQKLSDETSVIFTSDNGMMLGDHGLWGKWYMFEESIRVPLLIRPAKRYFPELKPNHIKAMALNIDLSPTILSMASVPARDDIHGQSLMPLMDKSKPAIRDGFFYEFRGQPMVHPCTGYRTETWKYTRYQSRFNQLESNECLYNLVEDPQEFHNLADNPKHKAVLRELQKKRRDAEKSLSKKEKKA